MVEQDHTEAAVKIKEKIGAKVREYIKVSRKIEAISDMVTNKNGFEVTIPMNSKNEKDEKSEERINSKSASLR